MPGPRRIFSGVSGSRGRVHALRQAAELAHHPDALLIPLLAWLPPDSRRLPWPELRQLWHDDAWQRLWDTLDAAFGGLPAGITTQPAVRCGNPGKVLTGVARHVPALLSLLREDALLTMPPFPAAYRGRHAIGQFLRSVPAGGRLDQITLVPTWAKLQPTVAAYVRDNDGRAPPPTGSWS